MRVLITGAAGFVGAHLTRRVIADGHEVHAVCRPGADHWRLAGLEGLRVHEVDLARGVEVERLMSAVCPDWVFHLAAHGAYSWQADPLRICVANVQATINLADAAERARVRAFVHAGSSSEYGFKDHPAREDERLDPNSAYAVTKATATMYCAHRAREGSLPAVTLRLYSVYGALEDSRRLIVTLLREGLRRCLPPLVAPETVRDFVYVDDVCDSFICAAEHAGERAGEIYNVGSGRQTTLRELVDCVRKLFGIRQEPAWGTHAARRWDAEIWCASTSHIFNDLGWRASISVEGGLRRMLAAMTVAAPSPVATTEAVPSSPMAGAIGGVAAGSSLLARS